jgi:hypothetical protein
MYLSALLIAQTALDPRRRGLSGKIERGISARPWIMGGDKKP